MDVKTAFNSAICLIAIPILLIHIVNLLIKKGKRRDEMFLLLFFVFTAVHFRCFERFLFSVLKGFHSVF